MEETNFVLLWKEHYDKIDESLRINKQLLQEAIHRKATHVLQPLKSVRWLGIIVGIIWCALILFIVIASWQISNPFFKGSLLIHFLITTIAVFIYIYHLQLISDFDNSQSIVDAQLKLTKLKESNLRTIGILWLQLPVFSTWFITLKWIHNSPLSFWFIEMPIVLLQLFIGVWIYRNLHYKNHQKNWFKWFISKGEFSRIEKANQLLQEIEGYKRTN